MRPKSLIATLLYLALASTGTAYASTVTVDGSYTVAYSPIVGNGPTITDDLHSPFSELLTPGVATSKLNFFTASPASTACGWWCTGNLAEGTITVTFSFTEPTGATGNLVETGTYEAKYSGFALPCTNSPAGKTDCIVWSPSNDPLTVTFSNGDVLDVTLYNAQDWAITPQISFELTQTPLPAALPLFLTGIGGIGLLGYRRKRKTAQVC